MKHASILSFCLLLVLTGFSQARDGNITYQKTRQPAMVIDLPYSSGVTESAIENYLSTKGAKASDSHGFKTYKNVRIGDTATADLYFKIEKKSQTESTVYLVTMPVNENITTETAASVFAQDDARNLLNSLAPAAETAQLGVQVKGQQDAVGKAEKKLKNLVDEEADLKKKRTHLDEKITENQQLQEKQRVEIEKEKQTLSSLMGRKGS